MRVRMNAMAWLVAVLGCFALPATSNATGVLSELLEEQFHGPIEKIEQKVFRHDRLKREKIHEMTTHYEFDNDDRLRQMVTTRPSVPEEHQDDQIVDVRYDKAGRLWATRARLKSGEGEPFITILKRDEHGRISGRRIKVGEIEPEQMSHEYKWEKIDGQDVLTIAVRRPTDGKIVAREIQTYQDDRLSKIEQYGLGEAKPSTVRKFDAKGMLVEEIAIVPSLYSYEFDEQGN